MEFFFRIADGTLHVFEPAQKNSGLYQVSARASGAGADVETGRAGAGRRRRRRRKLRLASSEPRPMPRMQRPVSRRLAGANASRI